MTKPNPGEQHELDDIGAWLETRQPVAYTNVTQEDYVHTDQPLGVQDATPYRPPCHHDWQGPTQAMMEDADYRQRCARCGARRMPPEQRWQPVADIRLPLSPSVLSEVVEWLRLGVAERVPGRQLVVRDGDGQVEVGYYVTVQP